MIETINKLMRVQKQLVQEYGREATRRRLPRRWRSRSISSRHHENGPATDLAAGPGWRREDTSFGDFIEDKSAENRPMAVTACSRIVSATY